jgi:hypothetical protein
MKKSNRYAAAFKASRAGSKARFSEWTSSDERAALFHSDRAKNLIDKCAKKRSDLFDHETKILPRVIAILKEAMDRKDHRLLDQAMSMLVRAEDVRNSFSRSGAKAEFNWVMVTSKMRLKTVKEIEKKIEEATLQMRSALDSGRVDDAIKAADLLALRFIALESALKALKEISDIEKQRNNRHGAKARFSPEQYLSTWLEEYADLFADLIDDLDGPTRLILDENANARTVKEAIAWAERAVRDAGLPTPSWLTRAKSSATRFSLHGTKSKPFARSADRRAYALALRAAKAIQSRG